MGAGELTRKGLESETDERVEEKGAANEGVVKEMSKVGFGLFRIYWFAIGVQRCGPDLTEEVVCGGNVDERWCREKLQVHVLPTAVPLYHLLSICTVRAMMMLDRAGGRVYGVPKYPPSASSL